MLVRLALFLALWLILTLGDPSDILPGLVASLIAAWVSLRLSPQGIKVRSYSALIFFYLRFVRQSWIAGIDVARRAFHPRLPLNIGFVTYRSRLRAGAARSTFCTLASLLPGTLPADLKADGTMAVHCLDVHQPVVAELSADEALLGRALVEDGAT